MQTTLTTLVSVIKPCRYYCSTQGYSMVFGGFYCGYFDEKLSFLPNFAPHMTCPEYGTLLLVVRTGMRT